MKPEIKQKWVEALRSGKYEQGRHVLNRNGAYCCLGVLCAIAQEEGIVEVTHIDDQGASFYDKSACSLPLSVTQWAGITTCGMLEEPVEGHISLIDLNDEASYSFARIANVIEQQF